MDHDLVLELTYDDPTRAERVERSLRPEVGDIEGDRTRATLARTDATVEISIEAADLVALRAGLNTWLTLAEVAEAVDGIGSGGTPNGESSPGAADQ